jgi:hypothetical protein
VDKLAAILPIYEERDSNDFNIDGDVRCQRVFSDMKWLVSFRQSSQPIYPYMTRLNLNFKDTFDS